MPTNPITISRSRIWPIDNTNDTSELGDDDDEDAAVIMAESEINANDLDLTHTNNDDDDDEGGLDVDDFVIEKVAELNTNDDLSVGNRRRPIKKDSQQFSMQSLKTSKYVNSEKSSSLNSIMMNKVRMCELYVERLNLMSNMNEENEKNYRRPRTSGPNRSNLKGSGCYQQTRASADKAMTMRSGRQLTIRFDRNTTPPCEILAKINKWTLKTKEVIESRNKQLVNKKKINF